MKFEDDRISEAPSPAQGPAGCRRYGLAERRVPAEGARCGAIGFTLLELAMVMAVILILVAITIPAYRVSIQRAREAVLKDDLHTMRSVIDEYTVDKAQPPESLQAVVDAGYIHAIPIDPFTGTAESWQVDIEEVPVPPDQTASGVVDVHSGSDADALDGTHYSAW